MFNDALTVTPSLRHALATSVAALGRQGTRSSLTQVKGSLPCLSFWRHTECAHLRTQQEPTFQCTKNHQFQCCSMLITKFLKACRQKQGKGLARLLSYKPSANSEENPKKAARPHSKDCAEICNTR